MEKLTEIWIQYQPIIMTVFMALWTVVLIPTIRWIVTKSLTKADSKKEIEKTADKVVEKINGFVFSHDIKPIVESELIKVKENATSLLKDEIETIQKEYLSLIEVVKSLAAYFDNSIGVSDETKLKLKDAIETAEKSILVKEKTDAQILVDVKNKSKNNDKNSIER